VVDDGGEVCGSVETHGLEALVVRLHHALDAAAVRVLRVPVLHVNTNMDGGHVGGLHYIYFMTLVCQTKLLTSRFGKMNYIYLYIYLHYIYIIYIYISNI